MYRAVALKVLKQGIDPNDRDAVGRLVYETEVELKSSPGGTRVYLDGQDVTSEIRKPEVNNIVAPVAENPEVRKKLVEQQRRLAQRGGVVLEGRDTGSHVAPNADLKLFLTARPEERAERRWQQLTRSGYKVDKEQVEAEIRERDRIDSQRSINPLSVPTGAEVIDSTGLSVDEVVQRILSLLERR